MKQDAPSESAPLLSLEEAVSQCQTEVVQSLLTGGSPASADAIKAAVDKGHVAIFKILVGCLDADAKRAWIYEDALARASTKGHVQMVDYLLSEYGSPSYGLLEQNGLQAALFHNHIPVVDVFFAHFQTMRGISAVGTVLASIGRVPRLLPGQSPSVMSLNNDAGPDEEIRNYVDKAYGTTLGCSFESYTPLVGHPDGAQTMRLAARLGNPGVIASLIRAGHAVGMQDDHDSYNMKAMPIEVAAAYGHVESVAVLLDHGSELKRVLAFAVRFGHRHIVQFLLKRFPSMEVDYEKGAYMEAASRACELDRMSNRHSSQDGSAMCDLVDQSALALAVEMNDMQLIELLVDHKSRTNEQMPTLALSRALRDDRIPTLIKLLQSQHLWETDEVWIPKWGVRPPRKQSELDMSRSKDRFFEIQGQQRMEEPHSILQETLKIAVRDASSVQSFEAVKTLTESLANDADRDLLLLEAAEASPSLELLAKCSIVGPRGAVLLQAGLLSLLQVQKDQTMIKDSLDDDVIEKLLHNISDLCENDTDLLDELLIEVCRAAISLRNLHLLMMVLRSSDPARRPLLRSSPDSLTHLLLQHHGELPSNVPHLLPMASLLIDYGAQLSSSIEGIAMAGVCVNGWASLYFFLTRHLPRTVSPKEKFCKMLATTNLSSANIELASYRCHCKEPLDLLTLTIHGLIKSDFDCKAWTEPLSPGYGELIIYLLSRGLSLNFEDPKVVQFCQIVCFQGDEALLSAIATGLRRATKEYIDSMGLLQAACLGAKSHVASRLIELGASTINEASVHLPQTWTDRMNNKARSKWTPVQLATDQYIRPRVSGVTPQPPWSLDSIWHLLTEKGVSASDQQRILSYTLLSHEKSQQEKALNWLYKKVDTNEADRELPYVMSLVQRGQTDWMLRLVSQFGLDLNAGSERPLSLIKAAASANHASMLKFLLSHCHEHIDDQERDFLTDATLYDARFDKVLFGSEWDRHYELFEVLKRDGYDINRVIHHAKYSEHNGPLTLLGKYCIEEFSPDPEVIQRLLDHGADPNHSGSAGNPLMILLSTAEEMAGPGLTACIERLLRAGADPYAFASVELDGKISREFAIHRAVRGMDPLPILKLLVEMKASCSATGAFGTPLFQAKVQSYYNKDSANGNILEAKAFLESQLNGRDWPGEWSFVRSEDSWLVRSGPKAYKHQFLVEEGDPFFLRWKTG